METELNQLPQSQATNDFDKIIEESKQEIHAAEAKIEEKRGRGRPKGTTKKTASENPSVENADAEKKHDFLPDPNELKPLVKEVVKTPFTIFAHKFDEEKIELTEKEAETPAFYLSKYLALIMPDLETQGPKEFNLLAFLISLLILGIKKLPFIRKKIAKKSEPKNPEEYQTSAAPTGDTGGPHLTQVSNPVGASSYFGQRG